MSVCVDGMIDMDRVQGHLVHADRAHVHVNHQFPHLTSRYLRLFPSSSSCDGPEGLNCQKVQKTNLDKTNLVALSPALVMMVMMSIAAFSR